MPGRKAGHDRLDVEDGSSVYGVQALDAYRQARDANDPAYAHANPIRSVLAPLSEYAHLWPVPLPSRVAGIEDDLVLSDPIKDEYDFRMTKVVKTRQSVWSETLCVELNPRLGSSPVIVIRGLAPMTSKFHPSDFNSRFQLK